MNTVTASPRSRVEVEAARQAAGDWLAHTDDRLFVLGAIAAYGWVLGEAETPISQQWLPVDVDAIRREERLADDAIYDRVEGDVERGFAVGAQNALMWLRGVEPHPPISVPD